MKAQLGSILLIILILPISMNSAQTNLIINEFSPETSNLDVETVIIGNQTSTHGNYTATDLVIDEEGYTYITGYTLSSDIGLVSISIEYHDAFISRLHPNGSIDWIWFPQGSGDDSAISITLDLFTVSIISNREAFVVRAATHQQSVWA